MKHLYDDNKNIICIIIRIQIFRQTELVDFKIQINVHFADSFLVILIRKLLRKRRIVLNDNIKKYIYILFRYLIFIFLSTIFVHKIFSVFQKRFKI